MSSRATDEAQRAFELGLSLDDAGNAQRAAAVLARMRAHFATYRCSHCWLKSSYCICAHLPPKIATSVDVRVIAHGKEFGNCNNTAKLLPLMLEGASMLFHRRRPPASSRASTAHTCCCGPGRAACRRRACASGWRRSRAA